MSHTVKCKVSLTNEAALDAAVKHLGLQSLGRGTHKLYDGTKVNGLAVKLPGWNYPVVIDEKNGEASYDNYGGSWGKQEKLDELVQRYAIENVRLTAYEENYDFQEIELQNGDVEIRLEQTVTS